MARAVREAAKYPHQITQRSNHRQDTFFCAGIAEAVWEQISHEETLH